MSDGGWSLKRGDRSDVLVTSWVLQGLSLRYYDIDSPDSVAETDDKMRMAVSAG